MKGHGRSTGDPGGATARSGGQGGRLARRALAAAALAGAGAAVLAAPAMALPEGRAYELVSANDTSLATPIAARSTPDGSGVLLAQHGSPDAEAAQFLAYFAAKREANGWTRLERGGKSSWPSASTQNHRALSTTPDLSSVLIQSTVGIAPGDTDPTQDDVYRMAGGGSEWLSVGDFTPDPGNFSAEVRSATPDHSSVLIHGAGPLLAGVPNNQLYVHKDGRLKVVSKLPDESFPAVAPSAPAAIGAYSGHDGTSSVTAVRQAAPDRDPNVISDDGNRVFFNVGNPGAGPLYMRNVSAEATIPISASQRPGEENDPPANARFIGANADGSQVVFGSNAQLTPTSTPNGGIYRYTVATDELELLVGNPNNITQGGTQYAVASHDLSHIYFITGNLLAPGASGSRNAYVWTQADGVRLIAPNVGTSARVPRVTPDGAYALFTTTAALGGAQNGGKSAIYRYESATSQLICVSCRPSGANTADASLGLIEATQTALQSAQFVVKPRNVASDGTVVFDSRDALLPEDENTVPDVYEYRDGQLALLSSGKSEYQSLLGDVSEDGSTIYFTTNDALTGWDTDGGVADVYAVRYGDGLPEPEQPPVPCAASESCQDGPPTAPVFGGAGSATTGPSGNVVPPPDAPAGEPAPSRVTAARFSAATLRNLVRRGATDLRVTLEGGGKVTVRVRGRIGSRTVTLASGSRTVKQTGKVTAKVRVKLSKAAKRQLARGKRLRATVEVRVSGSKTVMKQSVSLRGAR